MKRHDIPRPSPLRHHSCNLPYEAIEPSLHEMGNTKLNKFMEFIQQQSEGIEKHKRFEIYEREEIVHAQPIYNQSHEEVTQMEERDKAISKQLAKIHALTYALEQEQKCIRLTLRK